MKIDENEEDVYLLCKLMNLCRNFCAPQQINLCCQPVKLKKLHMDRYCCDLHRPTSKNNVAKWRGKLLKFVDVMM